MSTANNLPPIKHLELLKPEDIEEVRRAARLEIEEEQARRAEKELKAFFKKQQLAELEPDYNWVYHTVDVPASADGLLIDGRAYHHGVTYEVPSHQAASMRETQQNAWYAERMAGNPNLKNYIPPKNSDSFSAREVGVSIHVNPKKLARAS
jgi:hypothetical protein